MRTYIATTGIIFALVAVAHLARTGEVLTHLADDPGFVVVYSALTLLAIVVAGWALRLFLKLSAAPRNA